MSCELCDSDGGTVIWRDDFCRVVRPAVEGYPGFLRVIVNRHVKEMTDLAERDRLMKAVFACESALRQLYRPDKVNLASLGNVVPHVHWHVIARFADDAHFPDAIWAAARRPAAPRQAVADDVLARAIITAL
jgi:diadenosine tetraphosphate (Ap4A) HIT family hydrolase